MNARPEFADGGASGESAPPATATRARAGSAPIYYRLPDTPEGHHIKEYASGLRQLVRFVGVEEQVVKYSLT
ncbi:MULTISPECIES: hypothetical protein [unclassified Cupriavidus]|uniref:hypothetical protein n=1 Tax=unclassified Cupriavidus TaxID=2640874 RepID=UPI00087E4801|nr:hypothetical protein [Cupriavidus sp. YR651]SDD61400.1 hypothetical protein SAMN05216345_11241 [Cupriavidus sp. YR651]